jgi:hypothetical protein
LRSAAITFAENESSWRDAKRAKRESISTGTGTLLSDQPMAAEDEALGHIRAHPTQADYSQFHRRFSFRGQVIPHAELQSMNLNRSRHRCPG